MGMHVASMAFKVTIQAPEVERTFGNKMYLHTITDTVCFGLHISQRFYGTRLSYCTTIKEAILFIS